MRQHFPRERERKDFLEPCTPGICQEFEECQDVVGSEAYHYNDKISSIAIRTIETHMHAKEDLPRGIIVYVSNNCIFSFLKETQLTMHVDT